MYDYVIDANVLISLLISGRASNKAILRSFHFYAPEFILAEVKAYQGVILAKTKMNDVQFRQYSIDVFQELTIFPEYISSVENLQKANDMLKKIDPKDTQYFALSLQLDFTLLTRDKPLQKGLKKQGYRKIMLWDDFLRSI